MNLGGSFSFPLYNYTDKEREAENDCFDFPCLCSASSVLGAASLSPGRADALGHPRASLAGPAGGWRGVWVQHLDAEPVGLFSDASFSKVSLGWKLECRDLPAPPPPSPCGSSRMWRGRKLHFSTRPMRRDAVTAGSCPCGLVRASSSLRSVREPVHGQRACRSRLHPLPEAGVSPPPDANFRRFLHCTAVTRLRPAGRTCEPVQVLAPAPGTAPGFAPGPSHTGVHPEALGVVAVAERTLPYVVFLYLGTVLK